MLAKLYPNAYISSMMNLGPEFLAKKGIRALILDLDNTLLAWKNGVFEPDMVNHLKAYKDLGIKLCVVTNAFNKRVTALVGPLGIPWVARAGKPRRRPFIKALKILGTTEAETAVVGDQLFTDVLGGNRMGLFTILVMPINKKEFIGTRVIRLAEKYCLLRMAKKGLIEIPRKETLRDKSRG